MSNQGMVGSSYSHVPCDPPLAAVRAAVSLALAEDLLPNGDITCSLVPKDAQVQAVISSRAKGVLAGRLCAIESFAQIDPSIGVEWFVPDGSWVEPGSEVARVEGPMRSVLAAERTALNFLCHLSGVASATRRLVDAVKAVNPKVRILDTRKTTPGLRTLEKAAVRAGGGFNHRANLSEAVLVKDNHLGALGIGEAISLARQWWPGRMVEVECDAPAQVVEAVKAGASVVLLDNMNPDQAARCVELARDLSPTVLVEVSGGIDLTSAPAYAAAGVDMISVGAITHSAPVLDLGLDLSEAGSSPGRQSSSRPASAAAGLETRKG